MYLLRAFALVAALGAAPLAAQVDTTPRPAAAPRAARVLTHTFSSPSREFVRVRLESNQTYRAQLSVPKARLEIRPLSPGVQPPVIRDAGQREGRAHYEIRPRGTSDYEIRVLGEGGLKQPVRLVIDRRS